MHYSLSGNKKPMRVLNFGGSPAKEKGVEKYHIQITSVIRKSHYESGKAVFENKIQDPQDDYGIVSCRPDQLRTAISRLKTQALDRIRALIDADPYEKFNSLVSQSHAQVSENTLNKNSHDPMEINMRGVPISYNFITGTDNNEQEQGYCAVDYLIQTYGKNTNIIKRKTGRTFRV